VDTLDSMRVFRAVAELTSFAAAGRRLELSPAMVSKHVMNLEQRLGTRLLNRTSRHVSLTETGALYFEQSRQMLDALEEVESAITKARVVPRGTLRISAPIWVANPMFVTMLADYRALYPEVSFEMDLSGRIVNMVEEGLDLALRASGSPGDQLIARPLAIVPFYLVAAPAYLDKAGYPQRVSDLAQHAVLWYSLAPLDTQWAGSDANRSETVTVKPVVRSANETLLHFSALQGMGLAMLPIWMIEDDLRSSRLVRVLGDQGRRDVTLYGVYPSRKYLSPKVRTFLDFLLDDSRLKTAFEV